MAWNSLTKHKHIQHHQGFVPEDQLGSGARGSNYVLTAGGSNFAYWDLPKRIIIPLTNQSGGSVVVGDVVIVDTANNESFTTSTASNYSGWVGVVQEPISAGAIGQVLIEGYAPVVTTTAAASRGQFLYQSTTAKQAASSSLLLKGAFAYVLEASDDPSAIVFPQWRGLPDITASASNTFPSILNLRPGSNVNFGISGDTLTINSSGGGGGGGSLTVKEQDGTPNVGSVTEIRVSNGTLTDEGSGAVSITTGGGGGGAPTDAKYIVTEANGTLSAEIIIPGLEASPDIRVAGTNDQEFESTTIGGTALGTPTTIDADTTTPNHLYIKKAATASFGLHGRYWTAPSTPFTLTAKLGFSTPPIANFMRSGVGIAEATPGKTEGIYWEINAQRYLSTISTTTPTTGAAYVQQGAEHTTECHRAPIWFRVVAASSTDITWYWSVDGRHFIRIGTANRNPGFTIGSYFVAVNPEQATHDVESSWDWIRFT